MDAVVICFFCGLSSQLAYQAWVSSVKQALRERQRRQKQMKRTIKGEREGKEASRKETFPTAASSGRIFTLTGYQQRAPMKKEKTDLKKKKINTAHFLVSVEHLIHKFNESDFCT